MRKELSESLLKLAHSNSSFVFLTGDLGFMAFEKLEAALGKRFVNMGISEQNMISVAASLAHDKFIPFVYSIAPFVITRPFEQIRNEIGMHHMSVKLVGNGGGYGYGIMGSTHHCLEDLALMRSVQNMCIYVPAYNNDIEEVIQMMVNDIRPNYLRLNNSVARPASIASFGAWRKLADGDAGVIIGIGPVVLNTVVFNETLQLNLAIWAIGILPFDAIPEACMEQINQTGRVLIIEEHFAAGGLGEMMAMQLLKHPGILNKNIHFESLSAQGYPSGNYGDQQWHQEENSLGGKSLEKALQQFINF
ncbi:MAG: transketolase [Bacteroidia bacterium]|nr:transketolase [Bacteroidia bacterium]